jgi:hypothetical protein
MGPSRLSAGSFSGSADCGGASQLPSRLPRAEVVPWVPKLDCITCAAPQSNPETLNLIPMTATYRTLLFSVILFYIASFMVEAKRATFVTSLYSPHQRSKWMD